MRLWWGSGRIEGGFGPVLDHAGHQHYPFGMRTGGKLDISFQHMTRPPFDDIGLRRELLRRLNEIPRVSIPEDAITRRPSIPLAVFGTDADALKSLKGVLDWFCETVRASGGDRLDS